MKTNTNARTAGEPITESIILAQKHGTDLLGGLLSWYSRNRTTERNVIHGLLLKEVRLLEALQAQAREEFAATRGWRVARLKHWRGCRELDHLEWFEHPTDRTMVALVTHSYVPREDMEKFAHAYGYAMEFLPWSWYFPNGTTAAVMTPNTPATKRRPFSRWLGLPGSADAQDSDAAASANDDLI